MIDGGRAYIRSGTHPVHMYVVRNGEMVRISGQSGWK
jgi:hypothetical protein